MRKHLQRELLYIVIYFFILVALVFKPPFKYTTLNASLMLSSATILALLFVFHKKKLTIYSFTLIVSLYFLLQLLLHKITASFPLIISTLALLYLASLKPTSKREHQHILYSKALYSKAIWWLSLGTVLLSLLTIFESHLGRYSSFNGDPNYTALITLTPILIAYQQANSNLKKILCLILICTILTITLSRTAVLAILVYVLNKNIKRSSLRYVFFLGVFLFSISNQYIIFKAPSLLEELDFTSSSRLLSFNDKSNSIRIESYITALNLILENLDYFLISGARFYQEWAPNSPNIPHNWFIQASFGYSLLLTSILSFSILYSAYFLNKKHASIIPFLSFLFFYAGILSIYPLQVPLILVILYFISVHRLQS